MRSLLLGLLVVAGCGTSPDPRPVTFEVVTFEILAPTCGQAQCHSSSTNTAGLAFDTLEASRQAFTGGGRHGGVRQIQSTITTTGGKRMPPDAPLNQEDIDLFNAWVAQGTPGL